MGMDVTMPTLQGSLPTGANRRRMTNGAGKATPKTMSKVVEPIPRFRRTKRS